MTASEIGVGCPEMCGQADCNVCGILLWALTLSEQERRDFHEGRLAFTTGPSMAAVAAVSMPLWMAKLFGAVLGARDVRVLAAHGALGPGGVELVVVKVEHPEHPGRSIAWSRPLPEAREALADALGEGAACAALKAMGVDLTVPSSMSREELEELLVHARERGEAVVFAPPDGWELVPAPAAGSPIEPYPVDEEPAGDGSDA